MAQILVRNLDEAVVQKLKERARREGRSLQAEVCGILARAAEEPPPMDMAEARRLMAEIRSRFKGRTFPDSAELIREDRER
jgi:plasmid stability protein